MALSTMFSDFLSNLAIDNADEISSRYGEVTASLNKRFRDTESKILNSLRVGSIGRYTAIKGISDLDMLISCRKVCGMNLSTGQKLAKGE